VEILGFFFHSSFFHFYLFCTLPAYLVRLFGWPVGFILLLSFPSIPIPMMKSGLFTFIYFLRSFFLFSPFLLIIVVGRETGSRNLTWTPFVAGLGARNVQYECLEINVLRYGMRTYRIICAAV